MATLEGIAALMDVAGVSQRELARRVGCTQGTVSYWISNGDAPSPKYHQLVVKALDLSEAQSKHLQALHFDHRTPGKAEDAA